jgi:histone deacetylase 1/2
MPNNEYYEYYGPDYDLDVKASNMTDHNTPKYLEKLKQNVFEILRDKDAAPSVPLQRKLISPLEKTIADISAVPKMSHDDDSDCELEDEEDKDERINRTFRSVSIGSS